MSTDLLLFSVGIMGLIAGSITDIQRREVPDWLNYFLIFTGLGLRFMHSIATGNWMYFVYGLLGFGVFFILAYLMYFTGQWGGGDSKMLMAMGAMFATFPDFLIGVFDPNLFGFPVLLTFWINLLLLGAIYGIVWTLGLGVIHFNDMRRSFKKFMRKKFIRTIMIVSHSAAGVLLLSSLFLPILAAKVVAASFAVMIVGFFYLFMVVKSVDESCMYRKLHPSQLVEGDWPINDIVVDEKTIFSTQKRIGLELDDILRLKKLFDQGKIKKIKVRHGVPFVPSFLFSLILTFTYGNVIALMF